MKLLLDHHYSTVIAAELRLRGHDVRSAREEGWDTKDDEELLELAAGAGRVLITNNVEDFAPIAVLFAAEGRHHGGIIFTSDARYPRDRHHLGALVMALQALIQSETTGSLEDTTTWLK